MNTYMWAGNRNVVKSKGLPRLWHLTPAILPPEAERVPGRIPTLCGRQVAELQVRREAPGGPTCPRCAAKA